MKIDISKFNPCSEGLNYYKEKESFEQAWNDCPRGDWMLWIAAKLGVDDRILTRAKAMCATVRHLMKDERCTAAIDAALDYADGKISRDKLNEFADAAYAAYAAYANAAAAAAYAAYAAYADAAANAAYAAAAAANAYANAYAAAAAANAYANANAAAAAAYAAYAKTKNQQETADICRSVLTDEVFKLIEKL
ncbi:MAG: hypothetical protein LBQ28_04670 [Prevotellaceae bacterium]|jgi:hypothetical protein|nr:hypothetical protein [Prevotellaceae bacterium]